MNAIDRTSAVLTQNNQIPRGLEEGGISLSEFLYTLWEGRYVILGTTLLTLLLGIYYAWRKSPIYQVEAMLQVEDKKGGKGGPGMEALAGLFEQATLAQTEIEILKSNLVLGRTVEALSLDIVSPPVFNVLIGDALVRHRPDAPSLRIERFELANHLRGRIFWIISEGDGTFRWTDSQGELLAKGREGEEIKVVWQGQSLFLQVRRVVALPGQRFALKRVPLLQAIQDLKHDFRVEERGKQTNILGLRLEHRSPIQGAEILNEIIAQFVKQNIERRAEEASKTLSFLQDQMPQLRGKLDVAEERLNQYRRQAGSVDLPEEARLVLKRGVEMDGQISMLRQRKQELLRTYKEGADLVVNLDQQIAKLEKETQVLDTKVKALPHTQQELVRLTREVQANTDLYTALLNNAQQLQVTKAGEIGNARIVDQAMPSLLPVRPRKSMIITITTLVGIFSGIGLNWLRRALHRGVEDPRLIERGLNLPVVVTVPISIQQVVIQNKINRREPGIHLLALSNPDDFAMESLRSLRTSLHFTMIDAKSPVVLISGPSPSIGKSFINANFAAVMAQAGTRVLLVDGDMRKGVLHRSFGISERGKGFSEVLAGEADWEMIRHLAVVPGLDLITSGTFPPNPAELLMGGRLSEFLQKVSAEYDLVLIDAPPVLAVTDPVIMAKQVGTVLLIVRAEVHSLDEIQATIQRFVIAGVKVQGCIFNGVKASNGKFGRYRYSYHYSYRKI